MTLLTTPLPPATNPSYSVPVRNDQGDFGTLGIYIDRNDIFVNGQEASNPCN